MLKKIGIIGAGVVGTAVCTILARKGFEVIGAFDIKPRSTSILRQFVPGIVEMTAVEEVSRSADILLIATVDSAIEQVTNQLAKQQAFYDGQVIIHFSGVHTSEVFAKVKEFGSLALSIHPLQSFANVEQAVQVLPGSVFSIEGDMKAYDLAIAMVDALEGEYFFLESKDKPLYHAGACVVSNYLVALAEFGTQLLHYAGVSQDMALKALVPLMTGTVNNLNCVGLPYALTGPIARGDMGTVKKHIQSLTCVDASLAELYCQLGQFTLEIADEKKRMSSEMKQEWQQLFIHAVE